MGRTKNEIAATLAAAMPAAGTTFVLEEESYPAFAEAARKRPGALVKVPRAGGAMGDGGGIEPGQTEGGAFPENIRLAAAIAGSLGIAPDIVAAGIKAASPDFGALKVWKIQAAPPAPASARAGGPAIFAASAFAANEPESSALVLDALRRRHPGLPPKTLALLNLRADRGDRTEQWLEALRDGFFASFERLVFMGDHARALGRRNWASRGGRGRRARAEFPHPSISAVADRDPARITAALCELVAGDALIVGLGNIGGAGAALVDHWARTGEAL
jgi:hypothetical protein